MALYFAYGSNMLTARLRARCPSVRGIGPGVAPGFDIAFDKIGQDGSGKATLVPAADRAVPGVLFDLGGDDLAELDRIEGLGRGYDRVSLTVAGQAAFAYVAPSRFRDPGLRPFDWYLDLVVAGARAAHLPPEWIARLASEPAIADPVPDRPRRVEALALLATGTPLRDMQGQAAGSAPD